MAKIIKCHWCKKEIEKDKAYKYIHTASSGKNYVYKGHKKCCDDYLERKERAERNKDAYYKLEELLLKIFKLPELTGVMRKHLNSWYNKGFDYDIILIAVKLSQDVILNSSEKPWTYHSTVIQNNFSKAIKQNQKEQKYKKQNDSLENEKIVIKINKQKEETNIKEKDEFDISDL